VCVHPTCVKSRVLSSPQRKVQRTQQKVRQSHVNAAHIDATLKTRARRRRGARVEMFLCSPLASRDTTIHVNVCLSRSRSGRLSVCRSSRGKKWTTPDKNSSPLLEIIINPAVCAVEQQQRADGCRDKSVSAQNIENQSADASVRKQINKSK
jgi:hypothetical protein